MTDGSVAAAVVPSGGVTAAGVVADDIAWGCSEGASRAEAQVATEVRSAESVAEGSDGAVVVIVADGTVALMGAPAEFPPPSWATPPSTQAECLAGVNGGVSAGAAGVVTRTSGWPGFAEPVAVGPRVALTNPPGVVAGVVMLRSAPEVRFESTAVRVPSTRPRVPVSDVQLLPTGTTRAGAPFDSVVDAIVPAGTAFAQTPETVALAAAIRRKN